MQNFEEMLDNLIMDITTNQSDKRQEASRQALLDWYEQVKDMAAFATVHGYESSKFDRKLTCRGCGNVEGKYGLVYHELDCAVLFADDLIHGDTDNG